MADGWRLKSTFENPHDAAVALRAMGDHLLPDVVVPVLQSYVPIVKAQVAVRIESTGIAHALQSGRASSATLRGARSKAARAKASDKLFVAVYKDGPYAKSPALQAKVWGLAALLEQGGRTRAHEIPFNTARYAEVKRYFLSAEKKAKLGAVQGQALVRLKGAGYSHPITTGGSRSSIRHPGSAIRAIHAAETVLGQLVARIAAVVDRALGRMAA